jgi:hypothetical protein
MAVVGNFKGKLISYEQEVADSILEQLKALKATLPDQGNFDENLIDYAGLLAAFAAQGKGAKIELFANGFSFYLDTFTKNGTDTEDNVRGIDGTFLLRVDGCKTDKGAKSH